LEWEGGRYTKKMTKIQVEVLHLETATVNK